MVTTSSKSLNEVITKIAEVGSIDNSDLRALRARLFSEGALNREQMNSLFVLDKKIGTAEDNATGYPSFFADAGMSHVIDDDGNLGLPEAAYLVRQISPGSVSSAERALLQAINDAELDVSEGLQNLIDDTL